MKEQKSLCGVIAAALTPMYSDFTIALNDLPHFLDFLANRGCHGALMLGTTGEGPSFSPAEREAILRAALVVRQGYPDFILLAGTGTPSLQETIDLSRLAFDLGYDGVVVLPPYYYRDAPADGLFSWFNQVMRRSVPAGGALFGYHIPQISGVPLSLELISRLKDAFPKKFAGLKDSSGDRDFAQELGEHFGKDLWVFTGNDSLFSLALQNSASGCITAMSNIRSQDLRLVWDSHQQGNIDHAAQNRLSAVRAVMGKYAPFPPLYKALLARWHHFPRWKVRPPLRSLSDEVEEAAVDDALKALEFVAS